MIRSTGPAGLLEMFRSFLKVARTLNVSVAMKELGLTRQTIRRHISTLETLKGEKFFTLANRKYQLTEAGLRAVSFAETLLNSADAWIDGHESSAGGMSFVKYDTNSGLPYWCQQHPLNQVWAMAPSLLQIGLEAWVRSKSELQHDSMKQIAPYLVLYRKYNDDWLCVEVGAKSSYATWIGIDWALSAVGCPLQDDPMHSDSDRHVIMAYNSVSASGGIRYDHVHTKIPRVRHDQPQPLNYQRLIFACRFPNGQPALATLIARTDKIKLDGISPDDIPVTKKSELMEFDL